MLRQLLSILSGVSVFLLLTTAGMSQGDPRFEGKWKLVPEKSSEIGLYSTLSLEIQQSSSATTIIETWGSRPFLPGYAFVEDGRDNQ